MSQSRTWQEKRKGEEVMPPLPHPSQCFSNYMQFVVVGEWRSISTAGVL